MKWKRCHIITKREQSTVRHRHKINKSISIFKAEDDRSGHKKEEDKTKCWFFFHLSDTMKIKVFVCVFGLSSCFDFTSIGEIND